MKAEDLYDEVRRKLGEVPALEGGVKEVHVDVEVVREHDDGGADLAWNVIVVPAGGDAIRRGRSGTDSWTPPAPTAEGDDPERDGAELLAVLCAQEMTRSRELANELEGRLRDVVRELEALKEEGVVVRERLPDTRESVTRKFKIARPGHRNGDLRMYVTVGLYPDGRPGEVFIRSDLTGSFASGALDAVAMVLSVAWQYGVPFEPTVVKLRGMRFEPQGATGDPRYGIVRSPLDYVARWLLDRFGEKDRKE
jgi:hypothetical protein